MAINETLSASPAALSDILSNGKRYVVPLFQRDYAWDETEWAELWADIREIEKESEKAPADAQNHYLGALVLQPTAARGEFNIIDGQQRLVTLSILALSIIVAIEGLAKADVEPEGNRDRAKLLREKFVSTRDPASLQHRSRLSLNATDNPFYQTYLVQGISPGRPDALKGSAKRLYGAFQYFSKAVRMYLGPAASGATLAGFLDEVVASRLRFIEIRVENDETAFTVFETLNARGVALGTSDLLKNFIFSRASRGGPGDLDQARLWWEQITALVPMPDVASLLFHTLAGSVPELREKRVFTEVKRILPKDQSVFTFLKELNDSAVVYAALDDPTDEFWNDFDGARTSIRVLSLLGGQQYRPVILAAFRALPDRPDKIARLLHYLSRIAVRATITRVNTGDVQRANQSVAIKITQQGLRSPHAIARALAEITPSDEQFRSAFSVLSIDPKGPRKKWLRYLLGELERAAGGQFIDFEVGDANIEHILPENPAAVWPGFSPEDRARDLIRLGNLTPVERVLNKQLGSADFATKVAAYRTSGYRLTNGIDGEEWNHATIQRRQERLAELANTAWSLPAEE